MPVLENENARVQIDNFRITGDDSQSPIELTKDDFTVSGLATYTKDQEEAKVLDADFTGGQYFTITFTWQGLQKLTQLAKDPAGSEEKAVYFYYSAVVQENAVIGPKGEKAVSENSGNPNKVKLGYKVSGYQDDLVTEWDKVTEFTFGVDVQKSFEGTTPNDVTDVTFKLYKKNSDGSKTYYYFKGENGSYHTPSTTKVDGTFTDALNLNLKDKTISLKGLDEGTYYLEETATVPGYNRLKEAVEIKIAADTGNNAYVTDADNASTGDYLGTFTLNDKTGEKETDGKAEFTVVNTQGFLLPSTGGAGIWMFVIGGVVIIAAGGAYFLLTRKKKQ